MQTPSAITVRRFLIVAVAYAVAAWASSAFRIPGTHVSLVWLPLGVAVTAMWFYGAWPWTAVLLAQTVVAVLEQNGAFNAFRVVAANIAAPLVVLAVLRLRRFDGALARFQDALALLAATAIGALVSTLINSPLRLLERGVMGDEIGRALNWWLGNVTGLLVIVPVALTWAVRTATPAAARGRESLVVALLLSAAAAGAVVAFPSGPAVLVGVLYLAVPAQVWAAARFGPRGGAQAFGVVAGGVLLASVTTLSAPGVDPQTSLVLLDGFLVVSGAASLVVGALVAENARAAAALAEARRQEAVRRLAGGLAHDFHNLLTVIFGHVDLLRLDHSERAVEQDLEAIRRAADRASGITQQLLAYGQQMLLRPATFGVNALVQEVDAALPAMVDVHILHRIVLADGLPAVRTDRDQLGRVLTQLCFRAAMGMREGGTLTITTAPAAHPAGAAQGRGVAIRVEDTGVPLTGGAVSGLLEPYAEHLPTGDPSRRPSGLELAMADGFARQVGGTVTVESGTGQGTAVTLVLPAAPPAAA